MSLPPAPIGPVPDHTAQIARAAFSRGNAYLRVTDLRAVWAQQYDPSQPGRPVRWRAAPDLPSATDLISSPYDPDAR